MLKTYDFAVEPNIFSGSAKLGVFDFTAELKAFNFNAKAGT